MNHAVASTAPAAAVPRRPRRVARWLLIGAVAAAPLLGLPGGPVGTKPPVARAAPADEEAVPPKVEAAVDKALLWLSRSQKDDGSWKQGGSTTAVPSLAVMAFLSRGHVPGQGAYGET